MADMVQFMDPEDFYKMVFVVNDSLHMGVGKVAAQVCNSTHLLVALAPKRWHALACIGPSVS